MKSKRLFVVIGNIDDKFIDEDAEEVNHLKKHPKMRGIYRYVGLAACVAVLLFCVWTISELFNNKIVTPPNNYGEFVTDGNSINSIIPGEDGDNIIPGLPDEELETVHGGESHVIVDPPVIITPSAEEEPGYMLFLYDGFGGLQELYALLTQDDNNIEEYLYNHSDLIMNGFRTRADIENLFNVINKLYFPFMEGTEATEATDTIIYLESGHVSVRYEVEGITYTFILNANANWGLDPIPTAEEIIDNWNEQDGLLELLKDEDEISIYLWTPPDDVNYGSARFIMNVKGVYTIVNVRNVDNLQTAIDGIFAFTFSSLM